MNNNYRRTRNTKKGKKEAALLLLSVIAVITAMAWQVPEAHPQTEKPITIPPTATMTATTEPPETEPPKPTKTYIGEFTVTAYCPCEKCCGEWAQNRPNGIVYTASGAEAKEGITVGAAWDVIPKGTKIEIAGLGERIVQDRPSDWVIEKYEGKILEVYFESHQAALEYGKQTVKVWIIEDTDGKEN